MSFFNSVFQGGIDSPEPGKRIAAIDRLAAKGGADAAARIGAALDDPDRSVARKAAEALARLRTPAAQHALEHALTRALAERAGPPRDDELESAQGYWLDHLADSLAAFGPAAAPQLIAILQNRDAEVRCRPHVQYAAGAERAAEHLGTMYYAGAASALIDRLRDPVASVRRTAARALAALRAASAVEPLIRALLDGESLVRQRACNALGAIADPRAVPALEAKLTDGSAGVRAAAAEALERLGWTPRSQDEHAAVSAVKGEYGETAARGASALRPLMAAIWYAYGIDNARSNDAEGMARQLGNLMGKRSLQHLPEMQRVREMADALLAAVKGAGPTCGLKDLKMVAAMPDLRVRDWGPRTHWSDEVGTYERMEDYATVVSCEELRRQAGELAAAVG
jgi:hypothetical protein